MVRGAWWTTVHEVARVGHDCMTKHAHSPVGEHTLSGPTSALFFHRVPGDLRFGDGGGYGPHWASLMMQQWKKIIHVPCRICRRHSFHPWFGKIPWRRKWQPTPVFLPGESHGQSSLVAYCPGGVQRVTHRWAHVHTCSVMSNSLQAHGLQHARPPCPSPTPRAYSNSCPLSQWCHPTILSSVVPFSSHLQSFPASGDFLVSQLFASGGQSIGASISCMSSTQLGRNMFCIMFEWKPSVWEEIKLYRQWTATLENRVVLCNWTCLSLVLI